MKSALITAAALYGMVFVLVLGVNVASGPVTLGLSFARAAAWPVWLSTSLLDGHRLPMD